MGRLVVVADGGLMQVPWAVLGKPGGSIYRPLIDDYEIASVPSAQSLLTLRQRRLGREQGSKGLALFADPIYEGVMTEASSADVSRGGYCGGREWPALPGTAKEAAEIRQVLGSAVAAEFSGREATLAALKHKTVQSASALHVGHPRFLRPGEPASWRAGAQQP